MLCFMNEQWTDNKSTFNVLEYLSGGQAVFETVYYRQGILFFWEKHLERLLRSLNYFHCHIDLPDLSALILSRIKESDSARVKLICLLPFDQPSPRITLKNIIILIQPLGRTKQSTAPVKLKTFPSPFNPQAPLLLHKTVNYGYHAFYRRQASNLGFDDALYLNPNGELMETSMSNIFAVKGDRIYTPPLSAGILPGTVREVLLEHLEAEEKPIGFSQITEFDYFFLSSSIKELRPVKQIDDHVFERFRRKNFERIIQSWEAIKADYLRQALAAKQR